MSERSDEEEVYFKALEIEQRRKLREKLETAAKDMEEKAAIAESVKTDDLELAERVKSLGFSGDSARVFDLLPLVHVAWADGSVQKSERAAILRVLETRGVAPGSDAFVLMESLLEERPSKAYMEQSLSVLRQLLSQGDGDRKAQIVDLCELVASSAGGFLGIGTKISQDEREQIEKIVAQLGDGASSFNQSLD